MGVFQTGSIFFNPTHSSTLLLDWLINFAMTHIIPNIYIASEAGTCDGCSDHFLQRFVQAQRCRYQTQRVATTLVA